MQVDNQKVAGFVAVSPPSLCPPTRTSDTDAILDMFRNANRFARLAVMEYSNFFRKLVWVWFVCSASQVSKVYEKPTTIWPRLDNEMRLAALRGVNISFIIASWEHTDLATIPYLQSLDVLPNIDVRVFTVPSKFVCCAHINIFFFSASNFDRMDNCEWNVYSLHSCGPCKIV